MDFGRRTITLGSILSIILGYCVALCHTPRHVQCIKALIIIAVFFPSSISRACFELLDPFMKHFLMLYKLLQHMKHPLPEIPGKPLLSTCTLLALCTMCVQWTLQELWYAFQSLVTDLASLARKTILGTTFIPRTLHVLKRVKETNLCALTGPKITSET